MAFHFARNPSPVRQSSCKTIWILSKYLIAFGNRYYIQFPLNYIRGWPLKHRIYYLYFLILIVLSSPLSFSQWCRIILCAANEQCVFPKPKCLWTTVNDPKPRVWVRIWNLCGGGEVYSNSHFWLFTWRQTIRRPPKHFSSDRNQMTVHHEGASNERSEQQKDKRKKKHRMNHRQQTCSNDFTQWIHRYTHCGIDSNRGDEWHYLLQKLLQLNSKLWSIAITSFGQYLLFNRPVVYVVHSIFFSPFFCIALVVGCHIFVVPFDAMGFSCSFRQWIDVRFERLPLKMCVFHGDGTGRRAFVWWTTVIASTAWG